MRIALVVTGGLHPSRTNEVIPALVTLVERLANAHEVHAFVLRHLSSPQQYKLGHATVTDLGRPTGLRRQWHALVTALKSFGPFDVIHGWWAAPAGVLAALAAKRLRCASVVTCDSGEFVGLPDIGYGLQRTLRGRLVLSTATRFATVVHVTSEYMESLARAHHVEATRIPLGIVLPQPSRVNAEEGPPWRVVQVASINAVKDQSTLLRALALARQRLDVRLELAGEDTLDGAIQREAGRLGLSDAVTFHGFVPHSELPAIHRRAHLYAQSSRHEAAGVAVLEAAAAGLPIVGTHVGYVSDWDGVAAVATPPADATALANAMIRVLKEPATRATLATAARERAALFDVNSTVQQLTDLYRAIRRRR